MFSRIQYKYLVAIVFVFGMFMDLMDSTVVNVALPRLSADFHASTAAVEWTVTGYLLSLAVFIPGAGFLSDRFGTKRVFLTAMGIFVACSALCGQAHSIEQLIIFRFLQGVGGGMMTPVSTAILSREFPGEERAKASAIIAIPVVGAPLMGPIVGGWLVQYASWRWIFYLNLPIGLFGLLLGLKVLREHREPYAQGRFDLAGLITGGAGAAMVLYALAEAATSNWISGTVLGWGLGGLAVLAVFVFIELRVQTPVLDLHLFRQRLFRLGNSATVGSFSAFSAFIFLLPLFLQELQGRSAFSAGLLQAPSALGTAISLPLASRFYSRIGPRRMLMAGFGLSALFMAPFAALSVDTPGWVVIALLVLRGLPFAFAMVAVQTIVYGPLDGAKQGAASSIYNTGRQVAASFGVALAATILVSRTNAHNTTHALPGSAAYTHAFMLAFHEAFILPAVLLGCSFVVALFVKDSEARTAMRRRTVAVPPVEPEAPAMEAAHAAGD